MFFSANNNKPFSDGYFNYARGVASQQGLTVGGKEGYTADDVRTFAPMIYATAPTPIEMTSNSASYDAYPMVPSRPFTHDEVIPMTFSIEKIANVNGVYTPVDLAGTPTVVPIALVLLSLYALYYFTK